MQALIFDCDGVLVDTERDGHRVAFNETFKKNGLDIHWDVGRYGELLQIAGGKERMIHYFDKSGWPEVKDREAFIKDLHKSKTDQFMNIIAEGKLPLRPGIARIIDEAIAADIQLAVCSTSNERAVNLIVEVMLGKARRKHFGGVFAGDMVSKKKPDPGIYNLAAKQLKLDPKRCMVIEDSRNGLLAAKNAGMYCLVTRSSYTQSEDFAEADRVVDALGDKPGKTIELEDLKSLIKNYEDIS